MDDDEDPEEKRRRILAQEEAQNFGAALGIAAGIAVALTREEQEMSQKYSEEYYALKAELAELQEQLSAFENAGGRAQKFLKLTVRYAAFTDLTPAILNEFISRIEVHERDKKGQNKPFSTSGYISTISANLRTT